MTNLHCLTDNHDVLNWMCHDRAPHINFWHCPECDRVWLNKKDIEDKLVGTTLDALYGEYGGPLIERGLIRRITKEEQSRILGKMAGITKNLICRACNQSELVVMEHKAASEIRFLLCYECESVWFDVEDYISGKSASRNLHDIYGDYDWPLIESGLIREVTQNYTPQP